MRFRAITGACGLLLLLAACGSGESTLSDAPATTAMSPTVATEALASTSTTAPASTTTTIAAAETTVPPTTAAAPVTTAAPAPADVPPPTTVPVTTAPPPPPPPAASGTPCVVSLHGKGGGGQPAWTGGDGIRHSFPAGNADGWGGRQWLYYPEANYQSARNIVAQDVAAGGCGRVVVYGFSNGAAFAAKLYCRGETFGGKVVGYVIDDPVVDHAVEGCARPPVKVVIYWTGDIAIPDGWDCVSADWTCEGGSAIGIARYEAAVGVAHKPSIYTKHQQYVDPPELHVWF